MNTIVYFISSSNLTCFSVANLALARQVCMEWSREKAAALGEVQVQKERWRQCRCQYCSLLCSSAGGSPDVGTGGCSKCQGQGQGPTVQEPHVFVHVDTAAQVGQPGQQEPGGQVTTSVSAGVRIGVLSSITTPRWEEIKIGGIPGVRTSVRTCVQTGVRSGIRTGVSNTVRIAVKRSVRTGLRTGVIRGVRTGVRNVVRTDIRTNG